MADKTPEQIAAEKAAAEKAAAEKVAAEKAAAAAKATPIPEFKTVGTGTFTTGGIKFTNNFTPVTDAKLAARLRKLNGLLVEKGAEEKKE